jgi:hypothetical protein
MIMKITKLERTRKETATAFKMLPQYLSRGWREATKYFRIASLQTEKLTWEIPNMKEKG